MTLDQHMDIRGLSPEAFAAKIGVKVFSVRRYLSGQRIPRPSIMTRIVDVTHGEVTANDFYRPHAGQWGQGL